VPDATTTRTRSRRNALAIACGALLVPAALVPAAGLLTTGPARSSAAPSSPTVRTPAGSATADAQARSLRHATRLLAREMRGAARCDPALPKPRFAACVIPALRHIGIGGRTAAGFVRGVRAQVSLGSCSMYLLRLQSANGASSSNARWLLPQLYEPAGVRKRRHIVGQIALTARMLRNAARAAPVHVCSAGGSAPAT
jgi:hypothetical protein